MDLWRLYYYFWLDWKFRGLFVTSHSFLFFISFFLFRFLQLRPYLGLGSLCRAQLSKKIFIDWNWALISARKMLSKMSQNCHLICESNCFKRFICCSTLNRTELVILDLFKDSLIDWSEISAVGKSPLSPLGKRFLATFRLENLSISV